MQSNRDPFGLGLFFELVKGNKTASGCVLLLMEVVTLAIFARAVWQVLSQTLPVDVSTQWTVIVMLGVFGMYGVIRLMRFLNAQTYNRENQLLPITAFVFALMLGVFCLLVLNGTFDSTDSRSPGITFFVLFYGLPLGSLTVIGMNTVAYISTSKLDGIMIAGVLISGAVLVLFLLWHFLALGLSGDYYPCLSDTLAFLVVLGIVFARRNRQRELKPNIPETK